MEILSVKINHTEDKKFEITVRTEHSFFSSSGEDFNTLEEAILVAIGQITSLDFQAFATGQKV